MNSELADDSRSRPGRTKSFDVPGVGPVEFHMRFRDRRAGRGYAQIERREGVEGGIGLMRGYGKRRTVLVQWIDDTNGAVRTWVSGPWPGLRGRSSPRYGSGRTQDWVSE